MVKNTASVKYMNKEILCSLLTCDEKPLTGCRMGGNTYKVVKAERVITFTTVMNIKKENSVHKIKR